MAAESQVDFRPEILGESLSRPPGGQEEAAANVSVSNTTHLAAEDARPTAFVQPRSETRPSQECNENLLCG